MNIYHNSQDENYRFPKGAVKTDETVRLSLKVDADMPPDGVVLRLWDGNEHYVKMLKQSSKTGAFWYTAEILMPSEPGLLWYYFEVDFDGIKKYYSNNQKGLGGEGVVEDSPSYKSYQITVYHKDFETPDWFKNAIMYQIFPDRFYRSGKQSEFLDKKTFHRLHEDWYEGYFFDKHPFEDGPACNDFYGGNLKGIEKKLGYLKELGISAIYLNPIFEAFSNHRYDTADYSKIDPILGCEEDFKELCETAENMGIKIILDGVFSHTGSDSIYFNKYGTYGENVGAFQNPNSPYKKWFCQSEEGSFQSWWGCSNLVNVTETEPTYLDHILTKDDAIIKKWLRLGASGFRLDVADELPDEFLKILRKELKTEKNDSIIIGEVWEDASSKVSYGEEREYLYGLELDGVMNYPFKDSVLGFLMCEKSAEDFCKEMSSIMENYPKEALYASMNLLGSHDTCRLKTVLSGEFPPKGMPKAQRENFEASGKAESLALRRMRIAAFIQMTFVGVPSIYYGDEIGMQGLEDPFCRKPFSWRRVDFELLEWYKALTAFRNSCDALRTGDIEFLYARDDVLVYKREIRNGVDVFGKKAKTGEVICCINRSDYPKKFSIKVGENAKYESIFKTASIEHTKDSLEISFDAYSVETLERVYKKNEQQ